VFEGLTPTQQKAIEIAAGECHQHNYALFVANNGPALQRLIQGGTQLKEFSDDIWTAFGTAAKEVLDGYMDDEIFAEIRTSYEAAMSATSGWMGRSDGKYTPQRDRVIAAQSE